MNFVARILVASIIVAYAIPVFGQGRLFRIKEKGKYGFIDCSGAVVIPLQFEGAQWFSEGLASVRVDNKYGFIDSTGKLTIEPRFDESDGGFHNGLAAVAIGSKWGYIDKSGVFVIAPGASREHQDFYEGLLAESFWFCLGILRPVWSNRHCPSIRSGK